MTELEYLRELTRLQQRRIEQLEAELTEVREAVTKPAPMIDITVPSFPDPRPSFPFDPRTYPRWQC